MGQGGNVKITCEPYGLARPPAREVPGEEERPRPSVEPRARGLGTVTETFGPGGGCGSIHGLGAQPLWLTGGRFLEEIGI